jgi:glycosyltransferase involved in cell wall biosynthesis
MRVLALGPTPPPYHGVSVFLKQLQDASLDKNSDLGKTISLSLLDTADRRDASNLGQWDPVNLQLGFSQLAELASQLMRQRPDILYVPISQNVPAFLRDALFIIQARMLGLRVVIHLHGGYFRELYESQSAWFQQVVRTTLKCVSGAIVLSPEFLPIFEGLVPADRVFVVENGTPDLGVWPLREHRSPPPLDGGTILYLSTLTRTKGILTLVESIGHLRRTRPKILLRVAGRFQEEDLRCEVEALIARENLQDSVEFLGNVDGANKSNFLANGDIFCLPTFYPYEGQPLVLLEAMAAGLPIASTQHAAIPSTCPDGLTGQLFPTTVEPHALSDGLDRMLASPRLAEYSFAARKHYLHRYTLAGCHRRLLEVFQASGSNGGVDSASGVEFLA